MGLQHQSGACRRTLLCVAELIGSLGKAKLRYAVIERAEERARSRMRHHQRATWQKQMLRNVAMHTDIARYRTECLRVTIGSDSHHHPDVKTRDAVQRFAERASCCVEHGTESEINDRTVAVQALTLTKSESNSALNDRGRIDVRCSM